MSYDLSFFDFYNAYGSSRQQRNYEYNQVYTYEQYRNNKLDNTDYYSRQGKALAVSVILRGFFVSYYRTYKTRNRDEKGQNKADYRHGIFLFFDIRKLLAGGNAAIRTDNRLIA